MSDQTNCKPFRADGSPKGHSPPTSHDKDNNELRQDSSFSKKHQEMVPSRVVPNEVVPNKVVPQECKVRDSGFVSSSKHISTTADSGPGTHEVGTSTHPSPNSNPSSNLNPGSNYSSRSNSSAGSNSSVDPLSPHDSSVYSTDSPDAVEGGASEGVGGARGEKQYYKVPIQAKTKDGAALKGRKSSSKQQAEEETTATECIFTILSPCYTYKWLIGLPDAYRLNGDKTLRVHEEIVAGNAKQKNGMHTKVKLDFDILPDFTEPSNERVAKISVAIAVENDSLRFQEYVCTAVADISLYDRDAGELLLQRQEVRHFAGRGRVKFLGDLGPQERIEKSANRSLEVGIRVKVQLRKIRCEERDGYVVVK